MKEVLYKFDFIKIKNFCSAKDNVKKIRQATKLEKMSGKGLLSKINKNS